MTRRNERTLTLLHLTHCIIATLQHCNIATLQLCNFATLQLCSLSVLSFLRVIRRGLPFLGRGHQGHCGLYPIKGLYSLFSAVERFTYLRDFSNYFGLIDFFLFKFERFCKLRYSLNKGLTRFSNIRLRDFLD